MIPAVAIVLGVALGIVVLVMIARSRRSGDGVDSFRRQIDALSPEARRPVVDQVQNAASRIETRPIDEPADATPETDGDTGDLADSSDDAIEGDDDAGGARGA